MDAPVERRHPGRWVGGLIGALVSAGVSVVGLLSGDGIERVGDIGIGGGLVGLGLAGAPIAFLGGRALLPAARGGGFAAALGAGLALGLLAPPLGAVLVLFGAVLPGPASIGFPDAIGLLALLPIAVVYSYIVVFVTVPAGLAWGVLVALPPDRLLRRLEVPPPVARLGARHALLLGLVAWLLAGAYPYVQDATDTFGCPGPYSARHAWAPEGDRLLVVGGGGAYGSALQWVAPDGGRAVVREPFEARERVAPGPAGTAAWIEEARRAPAGDELWLADRGGARMAGRLPRDAWSRVGWWDGSWVVLGWESGLVRLYATAGGVSVAPVRVGRQRVGAREVVDWFSVSADGFRVGWADAGDGLHTWFALVDRDGTFDRFQLPDDAFDPSLSPDGRSIVYRDGPLGEWRRFVVADRSVVPEPVAPDRWGEVRPGPNGALAARDERLDDGRLCLAPAN